MGKKKQNQQLITNHKTKPIKNNKIKNKEMFT
jgi:hypothetical protein